MTTPIKSWTDEKLQAEYRIVDHAVKYSSCSPRDVECREEMEAELQRRGFTIKETIVFIKEEPPVEPEPVRDSLYDAFFKQPPDVHPARVMMDTPKQDPERSEHRRRETMDNIEMCCNRFKPTVAKTFKCYGKGRCGQSGFCPIAKGQEPEIIIE